MKKQKLLVLPHLFYPDVASTAQIYTELFLELQNDFDITVLCAVPCYSGKIEDKYKGGKYYCEKLENIEIIRVSVPEFDKSSKKSRIKSLLSFYFSAKKKIKKLGKFDLTFACSQPPILGGLLGHYSKKKNKSKLIYNIQDFNPEQAQAVMSRKFAPIFSVLKKIDKKTCRESDLIITVGRDLGQTIEKRFHGKRVPDYKIINNWIDEKQIHPLPKDNEGVAAFLAKYSLQDKFVFMYSGNIGLYYDLPNILKTIASISKEQLVVDNKEVAFVFVGGGSALNQIKSYVAQEEINNIVFIPYQAKEDIIYSLNAADVHLCINAKGIKGVSCPSKYYGIAAVEKPILAVLEDGSEIAIIIKETNGGLLSEPGNYEQLKNNVLWFVQNANTDEFYKMGQRGYDNLHEKLTKSISIEKYKQAMTGLFDQEKYQENEKVIG